MTSRIDENAYRTQRSPDFAFTCIVITFPHPLTPPLPWAYAGAWPLGHFPMSRLVRISRARGPGVFSPICFFVICWGKDAAGLTSGRL